MLITECRLCLFSLLMVGGLLFTAPALASGGGGGKPKVPDEITLDFGAFIVLDPLVLPIVDDRGISQVVSMVIVIEADSERRRDVIPYVSAAVKGCLYTRALWCVA